MGWDVMAETSLCFTINLVLLRKLDYDDVFSPHFDKF